MDDLGFSLKNLFHKKKKKSAPPAAPSAPSFPLPITDSGLPGRSAPSGAKGQPGIAPAEASPWYITYLPFMVGGAVILVGLVVIVKMRKKASPGT